MIVVLLHRICQYEEHKWGVDYRMFCGRCWCFRLCNKGAPWTIYYAVKIPLHVHSVITELTMLLKKAHLRYCRLGTYDLRTSHYFIRITICFNSLLQQSTVKNANKIRFPCLTNYHEMNIFRKDDDLFPLHYNIVQTWTKGPVTWYKNKQYFLFCFCFMILTFLLFSYFRWISLRLLLSL